MARLTWPAVRSPTDGLLTTIKRQLRARGWEVRRTDPDRSLAEHLWFLFPFLGVNCVFDVGAGRGEYGELLRGNGYAGRIVSFEPVPEAFATLVRRSAADPRWRACRYALGRETTTACINVTRDPAYSSFLEPSEQTRATFDAGHVVRRETVEMRRLDTLFDDVVAVTDGPCVFLKTTTQGWDLDVVLGAERRLDAICGLQVELAVESPYEGAVALPEAIAELRRAGFVISGLFDRPHHHDFRLAEVDCVLTRPAGGVAPLVRRW